jgi:hypothetical protein
MIYNMDPRQNTKIVYNLINFRYKTDGVGGTTTFSIMMLSLMTLSILTLSILTLSIMILSLMTLSIIGFTVTLSVDDTQHNNTR